MRYVIGILLLVFLGSLLTGVVQVQPGERVVVRRFGKVVAEHGPGLFVGLPWGLDKVDRVPVDFVRRVSVGYASDEDDFGRPMPGQLLTGDHNLVNVEMHVHYSVDDRELVHFVEQMERTDEVIARVAESAVAEWIARRGIDEVLVQGKTLLPPVVVGLTQERILPYHLGVRIHAADVAQLLPPRDVKAAFDEVNRAQALIETQKQNALQDAARKRREAATQKFEIEQETEAYVQEKLRSSRAEAARFSTRLEQYRKLKLENPNVLASIWWDEMSQLFRGMKAGGRMDLLDNHLGADGLDITVMPALPKGK